MLEFLQLRCATVDEIMTKESLQYDIGTIKTATANFSASNKLGQGAFGSVYKVTVHILKRYTIAQVGSRLFNCYIIQL